jgi:haloacetate dehalogenase
MLPLRDQDTGMSFFDGFTLTTHRVTDGTLRLRVGGEGPPVLLLHGNPQTHAMWHAVAPALAKTHTVICPDLRGYGGSFKPGPSADHAPYSKRAMARDMAELMTALGHDTFAVVAHDRGARVAHRLCIDNPGRVSRLVVMDIVPTIEHFERTDMAFALGYYHWFWFAQPHPFPEELINAAPTTWFNAHTSREPKPPGFFRQEALDDYLTAAHDPEAIAGMCEDYRAAATIDLEHDRISRSQGNRVKCPVLVLWGAKGKIGGWYDPVALWEQYVDAPVAGHSVNSGHYLAEEAPGEVLAAVEPFLAVAEPALTV